MYRFAYYPRYVEDTYDFKELMESVKSTGKKSSG